MAETIIQFDHVSKSFDQHPVLQDFSLSIEKGSFLTVIGRSGCGKTTALRLINGLISADSGQVLVQGEDVADTDPVALRRGIGYTIQNVGLFPHMTVEKNIAYVPTISKSPPLERVGTTTPGGGAAANRGSGTGPGRSLSPGAVRRAAPAGRHCQGAGRPAGYFTDGRTFRGSG